MRLWILCLLALCAIWAPSREAVAAESYDSCSGYVTSLPATIATPGTWCLKQDLSTGIQEGAAITIAANNVTLDCNGFKVGGLTAGIDTQALGVFAMQRTNVTVRNCNVRGFWFGISLHYNAGDTVAPSGHVVEGNRLDGNTRTGIVVEADASIVRDNIVINTGGTTAGGNPIGIWTTFNVDIVDNLIDGISVADGSNDQSYGIITWNNTGGVISGNRMRGITANSWSNGITVTYDSDVVIDSNVIHWADSPISCYGSAVITERNIVVGSPWSPCSSP